MAIEITVPRLGWSMEEGTFTEWLKQDGEHVREGDVLYVLESDKSTQEVESFDSGVLRIPPNAPKPGDSVKVGQQLAFICKPDESPPFEPMKSSATERYAKEPAGDASPRISAVEPNPDPTAPSENGQPMLGGSRPVASPSVRRRARELGIDLAMAMAGHPAGQTAPHQLSSAQPAALETVARVEADTTRASPRAARAAVRLGVNLAEVRPTGSSGRICERDVVAAAAARKSSPPSASSPVSKSETTTTPIANRTPKPATTSSLRQTIAARMLAAAQETASVTLTASADATELVKLRQQYQTAPQLMAPSFADLFVKLTACALQSQPALLGQWSDQGVIAADGIHIAVAVDTPFGLLSPVLRNVESKRLDEVTEQLASLVGRARNRRLSADDMKGGTFTVSNLGGYRVDAFTPLLNLPQSAILGVGRITPQPSAVDGRVEIRQRVVLSLTFDHRVADGATAATLLSTICQYVECPLPRLVS